MQNPDTVIEMYLEDFKTANPGRPIPTIVYENGWYAFRDDTGFLVRRHRRDGVERMRLRLKERILASS